MFWCETYDVPRCTSYSACNFWPLSSTNFQLSVFLLQYMATIAHASTFPILIYSLLPSFLHTITHSLGVCVPPGFHPVIPSMFKPLIYVWRPLMLWTKLIWRQKVGGETHIVTCCIF